MTPYPTRHTSSFVCTFLNEHERGNKFCNIQYHGTGDNCDDSILQSNKTNSTNNTLVVGISIQPIVEARYSSFNLLQPVMGCMQLVSLELSTLVTHIILFASNTLIILDIIFLIACDPLLLGDNASLPWNISCHPPYYSLGVGNGIACYSDSIRSGSTAVYFFLKCGFTTIKGSSTRTCLLNGSWTGSIPQCNCSDDIVIHDVVDNNGTCVPNVTSVVVTNFTDRNPGNIVKSPLFFGVITTSGALFVSVVIGTIIFIGLIASCTSKRQLQLELQRLKETTFPIYEDSDLNTDKNVAYIQNTTSIHENNC